MDLTTSHLKRVSQILKKIGEQTNMTVYFFQFYVESSCRHSINSEEVRRMCSDKMIEDINDYYKG